MLQMEQEAMEKGDGNGVNNPNSMGLEAVALFAAVAFLLRVVADVALRVRNGRSLLSTRTYDFSLDRLSQVVLTLMSEASRLYDMDLETSYNG